MMPTHIIIGLGNPGDQYDNTPHNAGFWAVDYLQKTWGGETWNAESKVASWVSKIQNETQSLLLAKPETFMNHSGNAANALLQWRNLTPDHLIVLHDDIDLAIGEIKIKTEGSAGGHNGVRNIIQELGTNVFTRLRIGVGAVPRPEHFDAKTYVLENMTKENAKKVASALETLPSLLDDIFGEEE